MASHKNVVSMKISVRSVFNFANFVIVTKIVHNLVAAVVRSPMEGKRLI